jgi:hypothetical protein
VQIPSPCQSLQPAHLRTPQCKLQPPLPQPRLRPTVQLQEKEARTRVLRRSCHGSVPARVRRLWGVLRRWLLLRCLVLRVREANRFSWAVGLSTRLHSWLPCSLWRSGSEVAFMG